MTDRYLTAEQVCQRYAISIPTLYRWEKKPQFAPGMPQPIRINKRRLWREAELLAWEFTHKRPRMDVAA